MRRRPSASGGVPKGARGGRPVDRRFHFRATELQPTVAHGGRGHILSRRVSSGRDGHAYDFVDFTVVPPRTSIGVHRHADDNEEMYVVLSGRARMTVDGASLDVVPGDVIVNRPGGRHGLRNDGAVDVTLVVIQVPVGASSRSS